MAVSLASELARASLCAAQEVDPLRFSFPFFPGLDMDAIPVLSFLAFINIESITMYSHTSHKHQQIRNLYWLNKGFDKESNTKAKWQITIEWTSTSSTKYEKKLLFLKNSHIIIINYYTPQKYFHITIIIIKMYDNDNFFSYHCPSLSGSGPGWYESSVFDYCEYTSTHQAW